MKTLLFAIAALAVAPAALADEFCDDLKAVIGAASEAPAPFESVTDEATKLRANGSLASMAPARLVRGLPEGARCERYLAWVSGKVVGGGTHNSFSCNFGHASGGDQEALKPIRAARDMIAKNIDACLAPMGWTMGKVVGSYSGRTREERQTFTPLQALSLQALPFRPN